MLEGRKKAKERKKAIRKAGNQRQGQPSDAGLRSKALAKQGRAQNCLAALQSFTEIWRVTRARVNVQNAARVQRRELLVEGSSTRPPCTNSHPPLAGRTGSAGLLGCLHLPALFESAVPKPLAKGWCLFSQHPSPSQYAVDLSLQRNYAILSPLTPHPWSCSPNPTPSHHLFYHVHHRMLPIFLWIFYYYKKKIYLYLS